MVNNQATLQRPGISPSDPVIQAAAQRLQKISSAVLKNIRKQLKKLNFKN
jgi:hypothetical protein